MSALLHQCHTSTQHQQLCGDEGSSSRSDSDVDDDAQPSSKLPRGADKTADNAFELGRIAQQLLARGFDVNLVDPLKYASVFFACRVISLLTVFALCIACTFPLSRTVPHSALPDRRMTLWDKFTGRKLSGFTAPKGKNLLAYLLAHPEFEVRETNVPAVDVRADDEALGGRIALGGNKCGGAI